MTFKRLRPVGTSEGRRFSLQKSLSEDLYGLNLARDGFEYGADGQVNVGRPDGAHATGAGWAGSTIRLSGGTRFRRRAPRIADMNSSVGVQI